MPIEYIYGEQAPCDHRLDYVYKGMLMEVKPLASGHAMIVRLINPPLDCYLNQQYSPGSIIPYVSLA